MHKNTFITFEFGVKAINLAAIRYFALLMLFLEPGFSLLFPCLSFTSLCLAFTYVLPPFLYISLFIFLSIYHLTISIYHQSSYIYLHIYLSLPTSIYIYKSIHLQPVCLYIYLSVYRYIYLPAYLPLTSLLSQLLYIHMKSIKYSRMKPPYTYEGAYRLHMQIGEDEAGGRFHEMN